MPQRSDESPVTTSTPAIYVRTEGATRAPWTTRLVALGIALGAIWVLLVAAWLNPDAHGVGTHTQLGLLPCSFLQTTGIPCAGCGMTTSFAYLVHGHVVASFVAQPFGMVLCIGTAFTFWAGLYVAITAKPAYRLLRMIPPGVHLMTWIPLALAAWMWKIALISMGY